MPPNKEKKRGYIGYRVPPDIEKKIDTLIDSKKFDTKADIISVALRFWFDNHEKTAITKEWLLSPEGKEVIMSIFKDAES